LLCNHSSKNHQHKPGVNQASKSLLSMLFFGPGTGKGRLIERDLEFAPQVQTPSFTPESSDQAGGSDFESAF
jgi:hypothetical protein